MPKVGIVMGSDSDMKVMGKAADMLEKFGIDYEMTIISAHREPDVFYEYAKSAEAKDFKVIIAGAGMAAHLPGMCAAIFPMPGYRNPNVREESGGCRRTLFNRSDAARNPGCHSCDRWRSKRSYSGCKDSCNLRS